MEDVARLQSVTTLALLPALEEVLASGIVRFRDDALFFTSEEVQRALQAQISEPARRMLLGNQPGVHAHRGGSTDTPAPSVGFVTAMVEPDSPVSCGFSLRTSSASPSWSS
ncbi:hypothetical protein [Nocardia sp. NPDC005998]|uniref:hypothetical protein n=1 Tax=Nocardia sp. NPDC005998 TaxID=3156894 RepID=UPI0033BA6096